MSKLAPLAMTIDFAKLRPHPIANEYPMCSDGDLENLKASIRDVGFLTSDPITLYGSPPMILDGRNRLKAGLAVEHRFVKENFLLFAGTEAEAEDYSNAKNGARRHLTTEQKAERIKRAIAERPGASARDIARRLGVSPSTVEKYKTEKSAADKEYARFKSTWAAMSEPNKAKFLGEQKLL